MKTLLLSVLLLPALALAEPVKVEKTVVCDEADKMLSYFETNYSEKPLWIGKYDDNNAVILVNPDTQTWSMVQFNVKDNIACLIEAGKGFKFKVPGIGV